MVLYLQTVGTYFVYSVLVTSSDIGVIAVNFRTKIQNLLSAMHRNSSFCT